MAKGGKSASSASSGTRKKHARKAAGSMQPEEPYEKQKKVKSKEKGKNKEPRQKIYIPPVKPPPVQPDPLDTTGLALLLPPDLLVVLRKLGKKNTVTKISSLEELQSGWVDKYKKKDEDNSLVSTLLLMLPVWLHHVSALFLHPSRRIRALAAGLHASMLHIPDVREQIFFFLCNTASTYQCESIIGTWCMATQDVDRQVASYASKSWNDAVSLSDSGHSGKLVLDEVLTPCLISFLQKTFLDPSITYSHLNPVQPTVVSIPSRKVSGRGTPLPSRIETPDSSRSKAEEDEENEQDRKARLRVGAFGAIGWILDTRAKSTSSTSLEDLPEFLSNPAVWTALHHAESSPIADMENFGFNQPIVRKAAWSSLQLLLQYWKGIMGDLLPTMSSAILRSAWVEPDAMVRSIMWQPLLTFLKEFPTAWDIDFASQCSKYNEVGDENSNDELDASSARPKDPPVRISLAYQEFLRFLELGCSGSPRDGYPTVVVVLSTIPSHILALSQSSPPLTNFFASFWAAVDGRALSSLERAATSAAFLSSLFECLQLLARRIRKDAGSHGELLLGVQAGESTQADELKTLIGEQFRRVWEGMTGRQLRAEESVAGKLVAQAFVSLNEIDEVLFQAAWDVFAASITDEARSPRSESTALGPTFLEIFDNFFQEGTIPKSYTHSLIRDISLSSLRQCEAVFNLDDPDESTIVTGAVPLINILRTFGESLFKDHDFAVRVDKILIDNAYCVASVILSLLLVYFSRRRDESRTLASWHALLCGISQQSEVPQAVILSLLDAAQNDLLPTYLRPEADELGVVVEKLLLDVLHYSTGTPRLSLLSRLLQTPRYFLSDTKLSTVLQGVNSAFSSQIEKALHNSIFPPSEFEASLSLIQSVAGRFLHHSETITSPMPDVFVLAHVLPRCWVSGDALAVSIARDLWSKWLANCSSDCQASVMETIKIKLKNLISDTQALPRPEDILETISSGCPDFSANLISDLFPSLLEIDASLENLPPDPINTSLSILEPLIPPASIFKRQVVLVPTCDAHGFSSYARVVSGLLHAFIQDRQTAKENLWALRHLLALALYSSDLLNVPSAQSPVFNQIALQNDLGTLITKVRQVTTYLLTSVPYEGWSLNLNHVLQEDIRYEGRRPDSHKNFLAGLLQNALQSENSRECRILHQVLQHILDKADKEDADKWLLFARNIERKSPQVAVTILTSVTKFAPEPQRLDRYRNELAASMLGIPATKINEDGLLVLQKLVAIAPHLDSAIVFLPQQRAVNVLKACQKWIASDEDVSEDVISLMTQVFIHLAPILQDVPGSHWELIFDLIITNLEDCSFANDDSLSTLARTLRLIAIIQDLASTNKSLRQDWHARHKSTLTLVRNLVSVRLDNIGASTPRSTCLELALTVIQDLPASLIHETALSDMCHLLMDSSGNVQKIAYQFLHGVAMKRTEYLVIEAAVDTEGIVKIKMPLELISILQRSFDEGDGSELEGQDLFGYLLAWMIVFDSFVNASLKVRSSYVDQLRNFNLIPAYFIPTIFDLLNLYNGIPNAFRLDIWAVDEYYVQFSEPGSMLSVQLLAAHLYYRSLSTVPSLIRTWALDCTDRQLHTSIVNYTTQHFSQVLVQAELAHVKSAESLAELADDLMTVKVASSVNEVTASYQVDDHQLEMTLKMPSDWPLHQIEIKDSKKIGVVESRWRAWVLGVQQTISAHNGHIADGLILFKKNVKLHFEGQVECPICYSIISVSDGTLPKKSCKTCKNRFHSACLYEWFSTSHSSSCPLCRSDIL